MIYGSQVGSALVLVLVGSGLSLPAVSRAQEIEPRAYAASPTGRDIRRTPRYGLFDRLAVLTDPSLPVDDVEAEINAASRRGPDAHLWIVQPAQRTQP